MVKERHDITGSNSLNEVLGKVIVDFLQCFDAVGWAAGWASGL